MRWVPMTFSLAAGQQVRDQVLQLVVVGIAGGRQAQVADRGDGEPIGGVQAVGRQVRGRVQEIAPYEVALLVGEAQRAGDAAEDAP